MMPFFIKADTITISDADLTGGQTYDWTAENVYLLDGFVYLEEGGVLNIEPGTVIKGKSVPSSTDLASALIITRGAQIFAVGRADAPIVFTAETDNTDVGSDLGLNNRGLWGGLIVLGAGLVSEDGGEDYIEGLPSSETRAFYGGAIADDNSGVLKYVSVRHAGAELEPDVEINGITLGGVGSGTTVDFVEVVSNLDDGIEIFGGDVSVKHLVIAYCGDESLDYDEGWNGNAQFVFAMVGIDKGDQPGEHDGSEATAGSEFDRASFPHIYNATYIGPGAQATAVKCPSVLTFKSRGGGIYANSIFCDYAKKGLRVEDKPAGEGDDSYAMYQRDSLKIMNTIWMSDHWNSIDDIVAVEDNAEDVGATALKSDMTGAWANTIEDAQLGNIDRGSYQFLTEILGNGNLDPRPQEGGAAYQNLASYDGLPDFFDPVSYKGAFGGSNWALGWTALSSYGFFDSASPVDDLQQIGAISLSPNPAQNRCTLHLDIKESGKLEINLLNSAGQLVRAFSPGAAAMGNQQIDLALEGLDNGVYFVRISNEFGSKIEKLVKTK